MSKSAIMALLGLGTLAGCVPYPSTPYGYAPGAVASPAPYYGGGGYAPYYAPEPAPTVIIGGESGYRDGGYRDGGYRERGYREGGYREGGRDGGYREGGRGGGYREGGRDEQRRPDFGRDERNRPAPNTINIEHARQQPPQPAYARPQQQQPQPQRGERPSGLFVPSPGPPQGGGP